MMGEIWDKKDVETAQTPDRAVPRYEGEVRGHARLPPLVYEQQQDYTGAQTHHKVMIEDIERAEALLAKYIGPCVPIRIELNKFLEALRNQ